MAAIDLEDLPECDDVSPLFPPRLARCLKQMAYLCLALSVIGWVVWGLGFPGIGVWFHGSSFAIGVTMQAYMFWYLWGE